MKHIVAMVLLLLPTLSSAHSMSPGFETEYAPAPVFSKKYELENHYDFPVTLEVYVLNKDGSPAYGWRTSKETYKMKPRSKKQVSIDFKSVGQRKLLVCSKLIGVGYEESKPSIISVVCSRLIINGVSK
jgi:hypothetical protein